MISFVFFFNILVLFTRQYHLGPCPIGRQLRGKSCLFSGLARKRLAPTPTLSLEVFHQPTDKKQLGLFHNGQWQYVSGAPRALPVKNKKIPRWYLCFHNLGCTILVPQMLPETTNMRYGWVGSKKPSLTLFLFHKPTDKQLTDLNRSQTSYQRRVMDVKLRLAGSRCLTQG